MTALTMWQPVSSQHHEISSYYILALFVLKQSFCPGSHYLWIAVLTVWPHWEAVFSLTSTCVFSKPWMKVGLQPGLIYFRISAFSNLASHNILFTPVYRICPAPFFDSPRAVKMSYRCEEVSDQQRHPRSNAGDTIPTISALVTESPGAFSRMLAPWVPPFCLSKKGLLLLLVSALEQKKETGF